MSFLLELKQGNFGNIKLSIPSHLEVMEETARFVRLVDSKKGVTWLIERSLQMVDSRLPEQNLLFLDVEEIARRDFETYFLTSSQEEDSIEDKPRTSDKDWSPVIEKEIISLGETNVLAVIRRLSYHPGSELIVGEVVVPTIDSSYRFIFTVRAGMTGVRESILTQAVIEDVSEEGLDEEEFKEKLMQKLQQELPQQEMDNRKHDKNFPDHPLSIIRDLIDWLLDVEKSQLQIVQPYSLPKSKKVEIENLGCAFSLPARFVYAPGIVLNDSMLCFTREAISPLASRFSFGTFYIWKIPEEQFNGEKTIANLQQFACEVLMAWEQEGATNLRVQTEHIELFEDKNVVKTEISFEVAHDACYSMAYWFWDIDGVLFRLELSTDPSLPKQEWESALTNVLRSWHRVPIKTNTAKKWWQIWKK
ncbi:MAG: hypothetical protein AAF518_22940 [Spirochaetota bacterium]